MNINFTEYMLINIDIECIEVENIDSNPFDPDMKARNENLNNRNR